jgi:hypothetical protein
MDVIKRFHFYFVKRDYVKLKNEGRLIKVIEKAIINVFFNVITLNFKFKNTLQ